MSNSGGVWLPNGTLLLSPHHAPELYVARIPTQGSVLELIRTIPVETEGQGIALDPDGKTIWAIQRRTREVLAFELP
jgi:sugar lactone lactonase YvrE